MARIQNIPPTPAVEHLPTIFRRIRAGEYRVPPFQREFVWSEKQVLELLESVYNGYPIGSALLWKVDRQVFKTIKDQSIGFPTPAESYPASFVLDGVQRLSSLNGVFNRDDVAWDRRLDVYFDLEDERFIHAKDVGSLETAIPLRTVFRPRAFLEEQKRLSILRNSDILLEKAIILLTVFQEYLFPIVTISNKDSSDVVSIFQRINSTGIRLGVVDFMRALTWSDDFDLSKALLELQQHFEEQGFTFDDELLLKALGIVFGLQPLPDVLLALRGKSALQLKEASKVLKTTLDEVVRFVTSSTGLQNAEALPYEAQWLLLFRLQHEGIDLQKRKAEFVGWLTSTNFSEALQGRPDHALSRMIDEISSNLLSGGIIYTPPLHIATDDILFKRFLRGKAVTVAYIEIIISRNVFKNLPIAAIPYNDFVPIFTREEIIVIFGREISSARTIGNVFYFPYLRVTAKMNVKALLIDLFESPDYDMNIFEAQFVDAHFIGALKSGNWHDAIITRGEKIIQLAKQRIM